MGANQQTSVPAFTAGQVLTAQQQTEINTGIPVFADSTARTAAFGGTGEKVLAEGQYSYLEDSDATEVYDGSSWVSVGTAPGLVLVSSTTIGSAVATVTVSNAFSATYENYKITISGGVASGSIILKMQLGAVTTGYYGGAMGTVYSTNAFAGLGHDNTNEFEYVGTGLTTALICDLDVIHPFLTKPTWVQGSGHLTGSVSYLYAGYNSSTTSHTDFTINTSAGTMTGGTIRVYGYKI